MLKKDTKIFLAGHRGLVGSAIGRVLAERGYTNVVTRTRQELDLRVQTDVHRFLQEERPEVVIVAAAKVGGILANSMYPADFIEQNLIMEHNLIWGSYLADVSVLLFLGSSCVYPRDIPQPMKESSLMTAPLEKSHAPYAVAKIAGIYMCDAISRQYGRRYFTVMPPNIFGPGDNYDLKTSHVMAALIRKFIEAYPDQPVTVWGTGRPRREFLYSDEFAEGCIFCLENENVTGIVNVGSGESISIKDLAHLIQRVVGHRGEIVWDESYPDGTPEKTMDVSLVRSLGWEPKMSLEEGIRKTVDWYLANRDAIRGA